MLRPIRFAFALAALSVWTPFASPQVPKPGGYYEDVTDLGFRVRVPEDWEFIPATPDEENVIGKYTPKSNKFVQIGPSQMMPLVMYLVKFDRRDEKDEPQTGEGASAGESDSAKGKPLKPEQRRLGTWIKRTFRSGFALAEEKKLEINKVRAVEYRHLYPGDDRDSEKDDVCLFTMAFEISPDLDLAIVFPAPGDPKKWPKYERAFSELARTFRRVDLKASKQSPPIVGDTLRDKKRAQLQDQLTRTPGWKLSETPNYFIVSNCDDREFMTELMERLEAIRSVYEEDYPIDKARAVGRRAPTTGDKRGDPDDPDAGDPSEDDPEATDPDEDEEKESEAQPSPVEAPEVQADPRELSRTSVVRMCATMEQYFAYGGPQGSAGFWNSGTEELVLFVNKIGGVKDTWATLNHEAFHQFIFYFYGSIAPHSWYNEGTGDFYSGYEYKNKRFTLKKFDWRTSTIKEAIRLSTPSLKRYAPLETFVRMTKKEYYGQNDLGLAAGTNYAQGWSFVYFLRTGKKQNAKGWNPAWDKILDTYLQTLATSGDLEKAVDIAFQGVDFAELEKAWAEYTR